MRILQFFRRPKLDPVALVATAEAVQTALLALEAYMEATADKRGLVMVRKLHWALEAGWKAHAPAMGVDVTAQSGGLPKPD
jgi:hypothetical protein